MPQSIQQHEHVRSFFGQALTDVVSDLPSLRVGISGESSKYPSFVAVPSIRLANHLDWRDHTSQGKAEDLQTLLRILEDEQGRGFADIDRQPPWRVVCVEFDGDAGSRRAKSTASLFVLFAVHHALADGMSTSLFQESLLDNLNNRLADMKIPDEKNDGVSFSDTCMPTLPLPLEQELKFKVSWAFFLKVLWKEFGPRWAAEADALHPWAGMPYALSPTKTNVRMIAIPSKTLTKVLRACRSKSTTLTPLIHAIILFSLSKRLEQGEAGTFTAVTPINLRPFFRGSEKTKASKSGQGFGVYVTTATHNFGESVVESFKKCASSGTETIETIWKVASSITADLNKRRKMIPNDDGIGLLPYVNNFHTRWQGMHGRPREVTWEVSNVGSMQAASQVNDSDRAWTITQSIFTQPGNAVGPAFSVNVSGVQSRGIVMSLCWQEDVVHPALMDNLAEDFRSAFQTLRIQ